MACQTKCLLFGCLQLYLKKEDEETAYKFSRHGYVAPFI